MKSTGKRLVTIVLLILLSAGAYFAYSQWVSRKALPEGLIQANGRMEGDNIVVAPKIPGRVQKLLAWEGDTVKAGQVLAEMDDAQVKAKVAQARQAVVALEAQVRAAETSLAALKREVPLTIETAEAGVAHARAVVSKAQATETQMRRDASRYRELASEGTVDKHKSEQSDLASTVARDELTSSRTALTQAEKHLAQAKLGWDRIQAKEDELKALMAQREQAKAAVAEVESVMADLTILAPAPGIIMTRSTNTGEVVAAGSPLFNLVDLDRLYLKVYVPEVQIGKLRLGLKTRIYTDVFPDRPFSATVRYISSGAEFTPKEVQTPDERVKLVYAVKLYLDENPDHQLTPGLPADAVIRWKEDAPWAKPRW